MRNEIWVISCAGMNFKLSSPSLNNHIIFLNYSFLEIWPAPVPTSSADSSVHIIPFQHSHSLYRLGLGLEESDGGRISKNVEIFRVFLYREDSFGSIRQPISYSALTIALSLSIRRCPAAMNARMNGKL